MYATLVLVALSGFSMPALVMETPAWLTDYREARQRGKEGGKPLAVFIGSGRSGWEQVSRAGKLGNEAQRVLASHYVCVYVDSTQPAGQRLAKAFEVPDGLGLVISDFSGEIQAFHHRGDLADQDLNRYLRRYTDARRAVQMTETNPVRQVSYYPAEVPAAPGYSTSWAPSSSPRYFGGGRSC
ncbi:MAG: hypothetical protein L0Z62_39065 [Gemmataceae bacterium]|nr:hypothetical protein [Gemmataceae bacterium]